ncbi:YdhK family protein, partial [Staphylococcus haemolyticus]
VKLEASHMSGMKGATANIDNVKKTTVYVVDYKSKDNGKIIKNHKWMTGNELKAR